MTNAQREICASWPTVGWTACSPEAQGMSSALLLALLDMGVAHDLDSVLLVRGGQIVLDAYYAPFGPGLPHALNSATKGVLGALVAIAQRDGLLALEDPILTRFADRERALLDPRTRSVTVQHLLDMSAGFDWDEQLTGVPATAIEMEASPDWTSFVLERPLVNPPGAVFNYNSGNSHLLSALLTRTTGQSALEFARRVLFAPLGIEDARWRSDPQGVSVGGYGLSLAPRDMAKLGYLHLRGGAWDGVPLLDRDWIARLERGVLDMNLPAPLRYANGWWSLPARGVYMAVGMHRQVIMVMPRLDMVAVVTGRKNYPLPALIDPIAAAVIGEQRLPDDGPAEARLEARIQELARPAATRTRETFRVADVSGTRYQFSPNPSGMLSLCLFLEADPPQHECSVSAGLMGLLHMRGPLGFDGTFHSDPRAPGPLLASRAHWLDEHRLVVESRLVCEGIAVRYELTFGEGAVHVAFEYNRGPRVEFTGVAQRDEDSTR